MARRLKSLLIPAGIVAAVLILGVSVSWNNFLLLQAKTYSIPSGSMLPTLQRGDHIVVRRISATAKDGPRPKRGDIVIFDLPSDPQTAFLKRVIGLPGEKLQMRDGKVLIDGEPLVREAVSDYVDSREQGKSRSVPRFRETLPDGRSYETLDVMPNGLKDNTPVYEVPDGHVFVLGDNRDNAVDSRFPDQVGFVPLQNISGVAEAVFYSGPEDTFVWRPLRAPE